jgi:hypothetical protein
MEMSLIAIALTGSSAESVGRPCIGFLDDGGRCFLGHAAQRFQQTQSAFCFDRCSALAYRSGVPSLPFRAARCSISASSSPPVRMTMAEIQIHIMKPTIAPSEP